MEVSKKIEKIKKQFDENINSHVFLIETDNLNETLNSIKNLISYVLNADEITTNQINEENYIELIIIRPTNDYIIKDDILNLQNQLKTKSILSDKKFYIIYDADALNDSASNKLLKTIEEPQEEIFGFLITDNVSAILPTIKSRCQIEQFYYNSIKNTAIYSDDDLLLAKRIIEIIETEDLKDFITYKTNNKKIKDQIKTSGKLVANIIKDYYNECCEINQKNANNEVLDIIKKNNTLPELITKAKYLNKLVNKTTLNMNAELLIDKIIVDLKEVKIDASCRNKV